MFIALSKLYVAAGEGAAYPALKLAYVKGQPM
jgi:hypothetical protein